MSTHQKPIFCSCVLPILQQPDPHCWSMVLSFEIEADWWQESEIIPELLAFEQDVLELMGKARDVVVDVTTEVSEEV